MFNVPQWIVWAPVMRLGEPKPAKLPIDPRTGEAIDPHDSRHWMTYETARAYSANVGFVLTDNDPYFCIDLDHAWNGAVWSQLAMTTLSAFRGAYVEVSYSGDGLHIIARGVPPAGYKTRGNGVELYHRLRFIAITTTHAQGTPDVDHSAALASWVPIHLPLDAPIGPSAEWTTQPVPDAKPIADDDELISRMINGRGSAGSVFAGKASAADLWAANVPALAQCFPSQHDLYDRSAADAALAAHLGFWTGKNCERIERLMRRSALVRRKWDEHRSYMSRTILGAVARVSKVYTGGSGQVPTAPPGSEAVATPRAGLQLMTVEQQHEYFKGCVYIINAHRVWCPDGSLLSPDRFNATYGGYEFQIAQDYSRPSKKAFEVLTESRATKFPKVHMTCFRPELPPGQIIKEEGLTAVNIYTPADITLGSGSVAPFLDLLNKMFPDPTDRLQIVSYLAALCQYPGVKFQWCPVIQGTQGNGKTALISCMEYAVGKRYTHKPNAQQLGDSGTKFNGWLIGKMLIAVEEVYVSDRRDLLDALKVLITNDRVEMQGKGDNQITGDNRANWIMATNHRDAIPLTIDERRYAVYFTPQQEFADLARWGMDGRYFPDLWDWLRAGGYADVAGYLYRFAIPDELNPAKMLHRAPVTSSTSAAIAESRGVVEQEIAEAIADARPGFCGGWVSSYALKALMQELRRTISHKKRGEIMRSLGYEPHPGLPPRGQTHSPIMQEGMTRPILYATANLYNLKGDKEITDVYKRAQNYM